MNKQKAAIGGAVLVALAAGVFGYPALQERLFERKLNIALIRQNNIAAEKAKLVEDEAQLQDFYKWYHEDTQRVLAEYRAGAPPKGLALIEAIARISQEAQRFLQEAQLAGKVLEDTVSTAPGTLAKRPDAEQAIARFDAAVDMSENLDERANQSRERVRVLIVESGASEKARTGMWQAVQAAHEQTMRSLRARPRPTKNLKIYSKITRYLIAHRETFDVAANGRTLLFTDGKVKDEYNDMVIKARLAQWPQYSDMEP